MVPEQFSLLILTVIPAKLARAGIQL